MYLKKKPFIMPCLHKDYPDYPLTLIICRPGRKGRKPCNVTEFVHYYLGLAFRSAGALDKSAYHFEEAVRNGISENIAIYYTNLGISYEEQQNYGESIKAYQLAYKSSRDAKIMYHLARNYDAYYS